MRSIRRPGRTIAAASAVVVLFVLALAAPALAAASSTTTVNGHAVVRFQDYTLAQGQTVNSVVVIRGNAVIGGTVTRTVVVIAGDATIESTAVVGAGLTGQASSVVVVGGHLTVEPGATIHGKTIQVTGFHVGGVLRAALSNVVVRPVGVVAGWWQLLFLPIVALVVSALFPRTIRRVGDRVRLRFWPSLGWGLVGLFVAGVLLVVLAITIVGLIVVVPAGIALPAVLLFCFVGVAALLGRLVLSSSERYRDNIVVAGVVGAALVSLVSLVPVIGGLALFLATMAGFGAALALVNEWRQTRRPSPAPAGGPLPPPQAGWTPPPPQAPGPPAGETWATPAIATAAGLGTRRRLDSPTRLGRVARLATAARMGTGSGMAASRSLAAPARLGRTAGLGRAAGWRAARMGRATARPGAGRGDTAGRRAVRRDVARRAAAFATCTGGDDDVRTSAARGGAADAAPPLAAPRRASFGSPQGVSRPSSTRSAASSSG